MEKDEALQKEQANANALAEENTFLKASNAKLHGSLSAIEETNILIPKEGGARKPRADVPEREVKLHQEIKRLFTKSNEQE